WALLGGMLAALHPRLVLEWGETYWGGALPMLGGALMFGALRRLLQSPHWSTSLLLGSGVSLLALSRPFECLVASLPLAVVLLVWLLGKYRPRLMDALVQVVLPTGLVLSACGSFLTYYNYRVTGDPFLLPYVVHEDRYVVAPIFFWQEAKPVPAY